MPFVGVIMARIIGSRMEGLSSLVEMIEEMRSRETDFDAEAPIRYWKFFESYVLYRRYVFQTWRFLRAKLRRILVCARVLDLDSTIVLLRYFVHEFIISRDGLLYNKMSFGSVRIFGIDCGV